MNNPAPPIRMHIRRGKLVPVTQGAAEFLRTNEKISSLLPSVRRHLSLQQDCMAALPAMFEACEVMQLSEGTLTISAPHSALASKLKQLCPKLQQFLQERGWQINAIRIKVQVKTSAPVKPPVKQLSMPATALQAFEELSASIDESKQNQQLKQALERLLRHHQRKA